MAGGSVEITYISTENIKYIKPYGVVDKFSKYAWSSAGAVFRIFYVESDNCQHKYADNINFKI